MQAHNKTTRRKRLKHDTERQREIMHIVCSALGSVPADLDEVSEPKEEELGSQTVVPAVANPALTAWAQRAIGAIRPQPPEEICLDGPGNPGQAVGEVQGRGAGCQVTLAAES